MDYTRLTRDEVEYELLIRGVTDIETVSEMKKTLAALLRIEKKEKSRGPTSYDGDVKEELEVCQVKLRELRDKIRNYSGIERTDSEYKRIEARLSHLVRRLKRINTEGNETQEGTKNSLLSEIVVDWDDLKAKVSAEISDVDDEEEIEVENMVKQFKELRVVTENDSTRSTPLTNNTTVVRKQVPVLKWGVCFSGDGQGLSVNAFLERVEELREARNLSKEDLWSSAIDLFTDSALIWFRAVRGEIFSWEDLKKFIRDEFLPLDYEEDLWTEIKARTQGNDERLSIYMATMTNLFARLPNKPTEATKLKILQRNILPYYMDRLALQNIETLGEFFTYCQQLDQTKQRIEKFKPPPSNRKTLLEPDLGYQGPKTKVAECNVLTNINSEHPTSSTNRGPLCWNCRLYGHFYRNCRKEKKIFCFSCGKVGNTTATCTNCSQYQAGSGNGQPVEPRN